MTSLAASIRLACCMRGFEGALHQPDYPGRFVGELHGRGWLQDFFGWHNDEHHHSGLALFTPADLFFGRVAPVATARQAALDSAYAAHPEQFPHGPPHVSLPPAAVHINHLTDDVIQVLPAASAVHDSPTPTLPMSARSRRRLAALRREELVASIAT